MSRIAEDTFLRNFSIQKPTTPGSVSFLDENSDPENSSQQIVPKKKTSQTQIHMLVQTELIDRAFSKNSKQFYMITSKGILTKIDVRTGKVVKEVSIPMDKEC
jgi:DNA recombination-dependent growth factor C